MMTSKMEDEYLEKISYLKKELCSREKEINQAATFGNQLLKEKEELHVKVEKYSSRNEILAQENYSLQANLEAKTAIFNTCSSEIEILTEKSEKFEKSNEILKKENQLLLKKKQDLAKEKDYFKEVQETLQLENETLKSKIDFQNEQLRDHQNSIHQSIHEIGNEDIIRLQGELHICTEKKNELQNVIEETKHSAKMNELRLGDKIKELEEDILDKDKEIASYSTEVKKAQDEVLEMRGEMEALKFAEMDVNKRGNSVFAELDDRRLHVETAYSKLKVQFKNISEKYEDNAKELYRTRSQMTTLLSMASTKADTAYITQLETNLSAARNEISVLTNKIIKETQPPQSDCPKCNKEAADQAPVIHDAYDYLRVMLEEAREKNYKLKREMVAVRTQNLVDNGKLLEAQQALFKTRKELDFSRGECLKAKLLLKETQAQSQDASETAKPKSRVEYPTAFKRNTEEPPKDLKKPDTEESNKKNFVIPAEVELDEEGFRTTQLSRMSILNQQNVTVTSGSVRRNSQREVIDGKESKTAVSDCERKENQPCRPVRKQRIVMHENCTQQ